VSLFGMEWSFTGGLLGVGLVVVGFGVEWFIRWRIARRQPK